MEQILLELVNTLEASVKKIQKDLGEGSGTSRLTINQFRYIDAIHVLATPTITELAGQLGFAKASVTAAVAKLINFGYVTKTQSDQDRSVFHVALSPAGQRLVQAKYQALSEYGRFIYTSLSEEESSQLESILAKLVRLFQQAAVSRR